MLNENDYMRDHRGNLVPKDMVKDIDMMRNFLVLELVKKAKSVSDTISAYKYNTTKDIDAFVALSAERYDVKYGGTKGNIQLLSFDGQYKIVKSINEYIVFDERLQVAKQLIDECVLGWSDGARSEIKVLVNHAFEVDKQGKINTDRILGLRRLSIEDAKWKKAMQAIHESIQITGSKEYIRVYKRNNEGKYEQIPLDLSAV